LKATPEARFISIIIMLKNSRILISLVCCLAGFSFSHAQNDDGPAESPAAIELDALFEEITGELRGGANSSADLQRFLVSLDALMTKYASDKSEDAGRIAFIRASFIHQLMDDTDGAVEALKALVTDMPDTAAAGQASEYVQMIEEQISREESLAHLVGNPAPELDFTWMNVGETKTLSELQGKVVVLDFWATWCGPCVSSFPHVKKLTEHYAGSEVEVIGVTSLQGRVHGLGAAPIDVRNDPAKEYALMNDYIAKMDINWTIAFSEQEVFNPDYGITGIPHMAIIAPDGTIRHRGLHPAMPHTEKLAMIDAILEEFALPVPGA